MLLGLQTPRVPKKKVTFQSPVVTQASLTQEPMYQRVSRNNKDDTDNYSICADVGTDEEPVEGGDAETLGAKRKATRARAKMASSDMSSDATPAWTRKEDGIICARKAQDATWAEISAEVERPKRECQYRYRELWAHAKELGLTKEMLANLYTDDLTSSFGSDSDSASRSSGGDEEEAGDDDEEEEESEVYDDEDQNTYYVKKTTAKKGRGGVKIVKAKVSNDKKDKKGNRIAKKAIPKTRAGRGNGTKKTSKGMRKKRIVFYTTSPTSSRRADSSDLSSGLSSSSSSSADFSSDDETDENATANGGKAIKTEKENESDDFAAEFWAQRRYFFDDVQHGMYPKQKKLRPDRFFSESDCRVLAGLEAKFRATKWLYIQADFCNATGRMVDAEVLKGKFYED